MINISLMPEIPKKLLEAAELGTLVPFIGAGASRLAGCPSWEGFADQALRFFVDSGGFNLSQFEQIRHLGPRLKLSIAVSMRERFGLPIDYEKLLHPDGLTSSAGRRLYGYLSRFSRVFVTTNYDMWLDHVYPFPDPSILASAGNSASSLATRQKIYNPEQFLQNKLSTPDTVIHLHGCLEEPDRMILTTRHYAAHYANDRGNKDAKEQNRVLSFLDHLFRDRTVLFIGYGLDELEILEYVVQKAKAPGSAPEPKHFILYGFFSHEVELARALDEYYSGLGIKLLPFLRDNKDWQQLLDVIEHFAKSMPVAPTASAHKVKDMRALLHDE